MWLSSESVKWNRTRKGKIEFYRSSSHLYWERQKSKKSREIEGNEKFLEKWNNGCGEMKKKLATAIGLIALGTVFDVSP